GVERDERLAGARRARGEVLVEHLLPGRGVNLGRLREHAIEIEQAGADRGREPEHQRDATGARPRATSGDAPTSLTRSQSRKAMMQPSASPIAIQTGIRTAICANRRTGEP